MNPRLVVLLLAITALVAKLYCAATTIGSTDVFLFLKFAQRIHADGLLAMYRESEYFNHTPLVGWLASTAYSLADGDRRGFVFLLRLPAIVADFGAVIALLAWRRTWERPAWWALGLYAASPVAFMVSGYHGNVDSVMALGILLAALAGAADRPALCGLCLGLACNVKIIPLLLAPAFFFLWLQRGSAWRFVLPAVAVVLAGWAYPLCTIPGTFLKNVLGYGSVWGLWGIPFLLRHTAWPGLQEIAFLDTTANQRAVMLGLKIVVIVSVLVISWFRRTTGPAGIFRTGALVWTVFFVFAPGFGAQYLAWLAPLFLLAHERAYAVLTATSSVALFVFYTAISKGLPWDAGFAVYPTTGIWTPWLLAPWLVLVGYLALEARAWRAPHRPADEAPPA